MLHEKKALLDQLPPLERVASRQLEAWYDIELAYTSNAIEGNTLTRSETSIVIEKGITVRGKLLKHHEEAVDHFAALRFVRSLVSDPRPLTESDIRQIHALVVARTDNREAGKYSSQQRYVHGSKVEFPSPALIPKLMTEFAEWLGSITFTAEHGIEAHLRLVTILPFSRGNGRTARLLMNLLLMRGGWPPIVIPPENRLTYFENLEIAQSDGGKRAYQDFMFDCLEVSLDQHLGQLGVATT